MTDLQFDTDYDAIATLCEYLGDIALHAQILAKSLGDSPMPADILRRIDALALEAEACKDVVSRARKYSGGWKQPSIQGQRIAN